MIGIGGESPLFGDVKSGHFVLCQMPTHQSSQSMMRILLAGSNGLESSSTDAASGVEYTRVIGDDSITVNGTGTSLLSSRLADGRPNAGQILDPGLLF